MLFELKTNRLASCITEKYVSTPRQSGYLPTQSSHNFHVFIHHTIETNLVKGILASAARLNKLCVRIF